MKRGTRPNVLIAEARETTCRSGWTGPEPRAERPCGAMRIDVLALLAVAASCQPASDHEPMVPRIFCRPPRRHSRDVGFDWIHRGRVHHDAARFRSIALRLRGSLQSPGSADELSVIGNGGRAGLPGVRVSNRQARRPAATPPDQSMAGPPEMLPGWQGSGPRAPHPDHVGHPPCAV